MSDANIRLYGKLVVPETFGKKTIVLAESDESYLNLMLFIPRGPVSVRPNPEIEGESCLTFRASSYGSIAFKDTLPSRGIREEFIVDVDYESNTGILHYHRDLREALARSGILKGNIESWNDIRKNTIFKLIRGRKTTDRQRHFGNVYVDEDSVYEALQRRAQAFYDSRERERASKLNDTNTEQPLATSGLELQDVN